MSLESLHQFFGISRGELVLTLVGLALGLVPLIKRYLIRPRQITYRVLYNSKIGISADNSTKRVHLRGGLSTADRQSLEVIRLLDRMSIVVIRIHNTGSFDITPTDLDVPLSFIFGKRIVWNARISEAVTDDVRELISENMVFFGAKPGQTEPLGDKETADSRGERLTQTIWRLLRPPPLASNAADTANNDEPQYHGVQLTKLALKRKEKFKLVVVLHEPVEGDETQDEIEIDKTIAVHGRITNGTIRDEKQLPKVSLPNAAGALAVLLFVALIASLLIGPPARDPAIECAAGPLQLVGSSVFMPVVAPVANEYSQACDGSAIGTEATGSKKGMLNLTESNGKEPKPDELAVLYDGDYDEQARQAAGLDRHPVAVIIYSVVVNQSVSARGVKELTTDQIRKIWSGEIKYWDDLTGQNPGRADKLPIRIVSRGGESGSRGIFENRILKETSEGSLTSDDCLNRKPRVSETAAIRCERDENADAIAKISSTEGAIGYVDAPPTNSQRKSRGIVPIQLDDVYPDISNIDRESEAGYPFWAVEYVYTKGTPKDGTRLKNFLNYLSSGAGGTLIQSAGYTPCVNPNGSYHQLCD